MCPRRHGLSRVCWGRGNEDAQHRRRAGLMARGAGIEGLLALRGRAPLVDTATAEGVARELYGITARALLLAGERDRNFLLEVESGRRLVLKFIDHEADDVVVAGQSAALAHVAEQDALLAVPQVVPTPGGELAGVVSLAGGGTDDTTEVSCRVRLVSYLPGRLLQDVALPGAQPEGAQVSPPPRTGAHPPPGGMRQPGVRVNLLRSVGSQIARLDRALVGFFHPALAQSIAWDVRRAALLLPVLEDITSAQVRRVLGAALEPLDQLLPRLRGLRSQAIHGDCHGGNLLVNEAADACVGIIDLGDMIHAPLALEIAVTMAELLTHDVASLDELAEVLAGYTSLQSLERADVEVLYDLMAARIAVGVLIQEWRDRNGAGATAAGAEDLITASVRALEELAGRGKEPLTQQWLEAAGVVSLRVARGRVPPADLVQRRRNALGASAELSYDEPLHLVRGEGVWVYTSDAQRFLDVYNNVPHVGHAHPAVVAAITNQAKRIASNTRYLDTRILEYVERLTETLPPELNACLFVNSGSEANDIAWRMAKAHSRHEGALVMNFAYHGITDAVTALSPAICPNVPPHVEQLAAPAAEDIIAAAAEADVAAAIERLERRGFQPAALMIDSALTSTGIYDPPPSWIAPITAAVRKAGGLIIGDEVQYGLGRSGSHFWGFTRRGYQPDIVTLGKPVGNGYPLGVVITKRALLEKFQRDTGFFSTFGGNPVAAAAGLAVLEVLDQERLVENARTTGEYFIRRLKELARAHSTIRDVRGHGLMIGAELTDRAMTKRVVNGLRERGVLTGSEGPLGNVLKLRPPMPFHMGHVEIVIDALNATLLDAVSRRGDRP